MAPGAMGDQVRDPRTFQPPPWEREQFEELRRRRELEQEQQESAAVVDEEPPEAEPEEATQVARPRDCVVQEGFSLEAGAPVNSAEVDRMMIELAAQEPDVSRPVRLAGMIAAAAAAVVGLATVVAGISGLVMQAGRTGPTGAITGSVVIVFGLLLVGSGGWLMILALKQRGA